MTTVRITILIAVLAWPAVGLADGPRPAVTIRLDRPDRQIQAVVDLFRGAKAPHPAAALAAWKRASREPNRLGKPVEALIVAFNPVMAGEIRTLDGAELALWYPADRDGPEWGLCLPRDDGSFAALATALVLSGGEAEGPMVDRLGPPGAPLMTRSPGGLLIGATPEGLSEARVRSERPRGEGSGEGARIAVDPAALVGSKSLSVRKLGTFLGATKGRAAGSVGLVGSQLKATLAFEIDRPAEPSTVDPAWLDAIPADRAAVAFAIAIDPAPGRWDELFRLADLVEKVDPARASLAPSRLRLELLARSLGVRFDGDLLPHLKGVVGWIGGDGRRLDRASLTLHLDDESAAIRIVDRVRPLPNSGPAPEAGPGRWLGRVEGRDLRIRRSGRLVIATWGNGVFDPPVRSARGLVRGHPTVVAAVWPARVPGVVPAETPLATALAEAAPVVWSGGWETPRTFRVEGLWDGLDGLVRRFLDLIPFDPPPGH